MKHLILCCISILFISVSHGQYTIESVPNNKRSTNSYISDPELVLDKDASIRIDAICQQVEDSVGAQIAVVILNSIGSNNPNEFGTRLFNYWGIGQAGIDNGLLVLLIMDQRRVEFITGNGLEEILPDVLCYQIQQKHMVPQFKASDYSQGVLDGIISCADVLYKNEIYQLPPPPPPPPSPINNYQSDYNSVIWLGYLETYFLFLVLPATVLFLLFLFITLFQKDFYTKYKTIRTFDSIMFPIVLPIPFIFIHILVKKLKEYFRNAPRFSAKTGVLMRRMSEHEDDEYLEKGMISEELVKSIDYDVWVGEDENDVVILPYIKRFSGFSKCPKCKYRTYKLIYNKTIVQPTYSSSGSGQKKLACSHCKHQVISTYTIAQLSDSSTSSGSSSWSSSSSSSSGGSWGGGSSSGGGAGSSW